MGRESVLISILEQENWGVWQPLVDSLRTWWGYGAFRRLVTEELQVESLFVSEIHGLGHIERTLCHGAFGAMEEPLEERETRLLLLCCAYHDVGRQSDRLDFEHGRRSARQLESLTGVHGQELLAMQAAVDAHSRPDRELEEQLDAYAPRDRELARRLALLLKDADGLDRVRIFDLNPKFLRRPGSAARADFAQELYRRYQDRSGGIYRPAFVEEMQRNRGKFAHIWD